ncbi:MAG: helix-turn-helix transcriptional regulator, partial [Solirubrobacteraceae bacterium]
MRPRACEGAEPTHEVDPPIRVDPPPTVRTVRRLLPRDLAAALRVARERLGLSRRDAALLAGVSADYLGTLERGRACPSVPVACELAATLSLDPALTERLMRVAVPDAGRAHPDYRDRPDPTRPARHLVSRLIARAAGVD